MPKPLSESENVYDFLERVRRNGSLPSLGRAGEIEREAETTNTPAIELFFALLDQFRSEPSQPSGESTSTSSRHPPRTARRAARPCAPVYAPLQPERRPHA